MKELRNALKPWVTGADRLRPREIAERVLSLPPNDRETALLRAARSVSYYHKAFWNTVFRDPRTPQGFLQAWVRAVEEGSWGCVAYTRDTLLRLAESAETPPGLPGLPGPPVREKQGSRGKTQTKPQPLRRDQKTPRSGLVHLTVTTSVV